MSDRDNAGRAVALRDPIPWTDLVEVARTAEQTGYAAIFLPEVGARETPSTLAALAMATDRVGLASGVLDLASRDPRTIAMAAATVQDLSGNRFILGVGAGRALGIDGVRARVRTIRALLAGGAAGDAEPLGLRPASPPPIWLAALGPRMTELAGELADGVLLNWCTPERVATAREEAAAGAARAGRPADAVRIAVYVRACIGVDEAQAVAALAQAAAMYADMPAYRAQFERIGLGQAAAAAASGSGEALARALCAWGTRADAERHLDAYRSAGADIVVVYPVPVRDAASSVFGTVLGLAPSPALEH